MLLARRIGKTLTNHRKHRSYLCDNVVRYKSTAKQQSSAEYCVDLVKQFDYENFLCTLLLSKNCRTSAFAIRAFNTEVARVQDQVNDLRIGQMRLKFWEETVENVYQNNVPKHPVAVELYRALEKHRLSKRYLKRLITARSNQLSSSVFPDLEAMELYAENSVSSVYYLLLEATGVESVHADHVASHLGKAHGLVNLIRSVPYNAQKNIVALPQDVMVRHNISQESVLRAKSSVSFQDAIFDIADRAKQHLDKARSLSINIRKPAHQVFLPAVSLDSYLTRLQEADFDVFNSKLKHRSSILPFLLFWKKLYRLY